MTGKMEMPFYHDDTPDLPNFEQIPQHVKYQNHKIMMSKKNMTAQNFPGDSSSLKLLQRNGDNMNPNDTRINSNANTSLMPPTDINPLKLASPDLEHLIIQSHQGLVTTSLTPSSTGSNLCRNQVTNEQEGFADGFVKALADLHQQNLLIRAPVSPSSSIQGPYQRSIMPSGEMPTYTNLSSYNPGNVAVPSSYSGSQLSYTASVLGLGQGGLAHSQHPRSRGPDEPQRVPEVAHPLGDPTSPPALPFPLDQDTQEGTKAERKRLRNRIAATKCRKRKLERISRLEEKVKILKTQNVDLASTAGILREQVAQLKRKVLTHATNGCQIAVSSAALVTSGAGTSR